MEKNNHAGVVLCFIMLFLISACGAKPGNRNINTEQIEQVGSYTISLKYIPHSEIIERERQSAPSEEVLESIQESIINSLYFELKISKNGNDVLTQLAEDGEAYNRMLKLFNSNLESSLFISNGNEKHQALECFHINNYSLSAYNQFYVIFPNVVKKCKTFNILISGNKIGFSQASFDFKTGIGLE